MKDSSILFITGGFLIFLLCVLIHIVIRNTKEYSYKAGYEAAVEDFYKGKLKCDRVGEPVVKYVWKEKK